MTMNAKTKAGLINLLRVLRHIWSEGPLSRVDLAGITGLDKSTITKITARLIELQLVSPAKEGSVGRQGGRRPVYLEFASRKGAIAGVEIGPDRYRLCYTDLKGEILTELSVPARREGLDERVAELKELLPADVDGLPLLGLGIGVPGIVDTETGGILESGPLRLASGFPLADRAGELTGLPVLCENDANCCAWGGLISFPQLSRANFATVLGELHSSAAGKPETFSVGFGFALGGEVYHGSRFCAGAFRFDESLEDEAIRELCRNAALLVNTLDLDALVAGGSLARFRELLEPCLQQEIEHNRSYPPSRHCPVHYLPAQEGAVAYGAAAMFLRRLMTVPALSDPTALREWSLAQRVLGLP